MRVGLKKKKQREKRIKRLNLLSMSRERERDRKGQRTKGTVSTSELADRPDLNSGEG